MVASERMNKKSQTGLIPFREAALVMLFALNIKLLKKVPGGLFGAGMVAWKYDSTLFGR